MISVALCVYNGERFLPEQLASIAAQTQPVDELVVCDDGSTDTTRQLIEAFGKTVSFPVYFHQNPQQLGSTKNFERCLQLCKGDIIFLCDQDDAWLPEKVAKQMQYLAQNPDKEAVFSDGCTMDDASKLKSEKIWEAILFDAKCQDRWNRGEAYDILYQVYVVTGATLAIRARALPKLLPFPDKIKVMIHDSWIALVLAMYDQIGFVNEPLINYRQHTHQQVGLGGSKELVTLAKRFSRPREEKIAPIKNDLQRLQIIENLLSTKPNIPPHKIQVLKKQQKHLENRIALPNNRLLRVVPVLKEWWAGNYYGIQKVWWKTLLGDLLE